MFVWKICKVVLIVILFLLVGGVVVTHLWNWLMPAMFGLKAITWKQGIGLLLLSKILLGGFHRHGGGNRKWRKHRAWKRRMNARWDEMTPEERERFREGMRFNMKCKFGGRDKVPTEPSAQ